MNFNNYEINDGVLKIFNNDICIRTICLKINDLFNFDSIGEVLEIEKELNNFEKLNTNKFFNKKYENEYNKFKKTKEIFNEVKQTINNHFNINNLLGDYIEISNFERTIAQNTIISNHNYKENKNEDEINLNNVFGITDSYCVFQRINYNIFDFYFALKNNNFDKSIIKENDKYYLGTNTYYLFIYSFLIKKQLLENKLFKIDNNTIIYTKQ